VMDVRVPAEAEVCGAISLRNASPVEDAGSTAADKSWTLRARPASDTSLSGVTDIILRLTLAGRPR